MDDSHASIVHGPREDLQEQDARPTVFGLTTSPPPTAAPTDDSIQETPTDEVDSIARSAMMKVRMRM